MRGTINVSNTINVGSSSDDSSHFDVILHNVNMKNKDPEIAFSKFSFSDDVTTSKKETDITITHFNDKYLVNGKYANGGCVKSPVTDQMMLFLL